MARSQSQGLRGRGRPNNFKPGITPRRFTKDDPGGELIEVKILVNGKLIYGDSFLISSPPRGYKNTKRGDIVNRSRGQSILKFIKDVL